MSFELEQVTRRLDEVEIGVESREKFRVESGRRGPASKPRHEELVQCFNFVLDGIHGDQ
jgi:hypothetical protein